MLPDKTIEEQWRDVVIQDLRELKKSHKEVVEKLTEMQLEFSNAITELKFKSKFQYAMWGFLGGAIPVIMGLAIWILRSK